LAILANISQFARSGKVAGTRGKGTFYEIKRAPIGQIGQKLFEKRSVRHINHISDTYRTVILGNRKVIIRQ